MNSVSFGQNLKKYRKDKHFSQKDLGSLIEVGQTTVANYEKDLRFPSAQILKSIADVLEVSLDDLLGRKGKIVEYDLEDMSHQYINLILTYNDQKAIDLVVDMAKNGVDVIDISNMFLKKALYYVGDLWETGEISIPMEHHITSVVDRTLSILSNYMTVKEKNGSTALFMTPSNEPHLIGLKIVKESFRKEGWSTLFIGNSVPWKSLVEIIHERDVDLVCISITISENINQTQALIDYLREKTQVKIMLGGQAFELKKHALDLLQPDYHTNSKRELEELLSAISKK